MLYLLHTFLPQSIALQLGLFAIHWYGIFMVIALLAGLGVSVRIARWHGVSKDIIYDLFFYLVIAGFLGARIFYVLYNFNYFWQNPVDIFKIWEGGIAIHGALIFGAATLWWFAHHLSLRGRAQRGRGNPVNETVPAVQGIASLPSVARNDTVAWFWLIAAIIAPGLAFGQAIGRWGNYFNQEVFGLPTSLPWGIPIALANRPAGFEVFTYFHPTFLYESIGTVCLASIVLMGHWFIVRRENNVGNRYLLLAMSYVLLYSMLRFGIEFLRIDSTAGSIFGIRATQALSMVLMCAAVGYLLFLYGRGSIQKLLHSIRISI